MTNINVTNLDDKALAVIKQTARLTFSTVYNNALCNQPWYDDRDISKEMEKTWCDDQFIQSFKSIDAYFKACNQIADYQFKNRIVDKSAVKKIAVLENDLIKNKENDVQYFEHILDIVCQICDKDCENMESTIDFVLVTNKLCPEQLKYAEVLGKLANYGEHKAFFYNTVIDIVSHNYAEILKQGHFLEILNELIMQKIRNKERYKEQAKELILGKNKSL